MFTLDALRPLFSDPDPNLRAFAVRFAVDEASADETLLPLVLAAIGDHEDEVEALLPAFNLALSATDARALAARLDGEERPEVQEALVKILGMAPGEVLDAIPEASGAPAIARIARRLALAARPADALLDQAAEMDTRALGTAGADVEVDLGYALAARADVSDEQIVQGLERAVAPGNATTAVLLAAAARRRLRAAVPALIEILFWDEEFAADDAAHALGAIGDPESPAAILEALESEEAAPTLAPYEALGRIHTPESERVLLELLDIEDGWELEWVVSSLCRLGSLDGVNGALRDFEEAAENRRGSEPSYLEDLAMALQALGRPIPSDLEDALATQRDEMDSYGGDVLDEPLDPVEAPSSDPDSDLWWDPDRPPSVPYRREAPKVGRNDPCPCGSGKKYKKCHG